MRVNDLVTPKEEIIATYKVSNYGPDLSPWQSQRTFKVGDTGRVRLIKKGYAVIDFCPMGMTKWVAIAKVEQLDVLGPVRDSD